jgi:ATP-binding cassette subfamily B protein
MMVWPLRNVATILSNLGQVLASHDRIQKILAEPIEDMESGQEPEINGDIVFDHVSYQFDDGDRQVLNDVSFTVKPGQTIAVMGKTGSGKSTLFALLMRLHDYTEGSIKVSGVELRDIKRSHLRKKIAPVLQDPFLFSKTIYENIHLANKDATMEDVIRAAKIAAVDDTINSFQQGYQTPVGEKGVTLSGGQKQRVAIARTISSNAPVLIFDDSLSAVDTATDLEIRRHLKEMGRTVTTFIITHRVMSAKDADMILVLDHGSVSEMGTHEELIKKPGLYKTIYEIQSKMA